MEAVRRWFNMATWCDYGNRCCLLASEANALFSVLSVFCCLLCSHLIGRIVGIARSSVRPSVCLSVCLFVTSSQFEKSEARTTELIWTFTRAGENHGNKCRSQILLVLLGEKFRTTRKFFDNFSATQNLGRGRQYLLLFYNDPIAGAIDIKNQKKYLKTLKNVKTLQK